MLTFFTSRSVIQFSQLLVDQITNPLTTWSSAQALLSSDARFAAPALPHREKEALFASHLAKLHALKREALFRLFGKHAPALDVSAETAVPLVRDDAEFERGGLEEWTARECERRRMGLEGVFEEWRAGKVEEARREFMSMLKGQSIPFSPFPLPESELTPSRASRRKLLRQLLGKPAQGTRAQRSGRRRRRRSGEERGRG